MQAVDYSICFAPGKWSFFKKRKEAKVMFTVEKQATTKETVTTSETITTTSSPLPGQSHDGIDPHQFVHAGDVVEVGSVVTSDHPHLLSTHTPSHDNGVMSLGTSSASSQPCLWTQGHTLSPTTTNNALMFKKFSREQFLSRSEGTVRYYRRLKGVTTDHISNGEDRSIQRHLLGMELPVVVTNLDSVPCSDTRDGSKPTMGISILHPNPNPNPHRFLSPPALTGGPSPPSRINGSNNSSAQSSECDWIFSLPYSHLHSYTCSCYVPCSLVTVMEEWMSKTMGWDSEPQTPVSTFITYPPIHHSMPTKAVDTSQLVSSPSSPSSSPRDDAIGLPITKTTEQAVVSVFLRLLFLPLHARAIQLKLSPGHCHPH